MIFENNSISEDPSIYIYVSSKHIKSDAPKGCENWFLFITVPNDQGQNWDELNDHKYITIENIKNRDACLKPIEHLPPRIKHIICGLI